MSGKRQLFEEVASPEAARAAATPGLIDQGSTAARGAIRVWLMMLFALVVIMIAVGGLTRLTDSGLSITEWRPITGALPPLTAADWQSEFEKYQQIDEFRIQNQWMELSDFKVIYWWEWGHRQLGRVIGLVWALGFFGFLVAGCLPKGRDGLLPLVLALVCAGGAIGVAVAGASVPPEVATWGVPGALAAAAACVIWYLLSANKDWTSRLLFLGVLGGLQGAIGWWMVASGVTTGEGMVDVASYRLATHLGLAFLILGVIAWHIFQLGRQERELMQARRAKEAKLWGMSTGLLHLSFVQILLGALVAGIDAGRSYTDWPLMAGQFLPPMMWDLEPVIRNFFENAGTVQFIHRVTGYVLLLFAIGLWVASRKLSRKATKRAVDWAMAMVIVQMVIGIVTVLNAAPWYWAILHQFGAVVLITLILRARFLARYPLPQSVRGT